MSMAETVTNVLAGYAISILLQMVMFPMFRIQTTLKENMLMGVFFMGFSIIRTYIIRRIYNRLEA